jgi:hypothetical protein
MEQNNELSLYSIHVKMKKGGEMTWFIWMKDLKYTPKDVRRELQRILFEKAPKMRQYEEMLNPIVNTDDDINWGIYGGFSKNGKSIGEWDIYKISTENTREQASKVTPYRTWINDMLNTEKYEGHGE